MAFAREENLLSSYRKFLIDLSSSLSTKDLEALKFAILDFIPRGKTEIVSSGLKLFDILEQDGRITSENLSLLGELFETIGRMDLAEKVQYFSKSSVGDDINDSQHEPDVTDHHGIVHPVAEIEKILFNEGDSDIMHDGANSDDVVTDGGGEEPESNRSVGKCRIAHHADLTAPVSEGPVGGPASDVAPWLQAQPGQGRIQHDFTAGPPPVRYVNYLAHRGYSVEIIGGKHFKTPDGEFVELKSGTQYKIHVKNSHAYGCNLDVSIDGYDVGGWVLYGKQELTIERPADEPKKFTFYRVKSAPKDAGIESGRHENGVVKCVFTPEAFLVIPVAVSRLPDPVKVTIAPDAIVGDLKCQLQTQLGAALDPDQILALNDKVLSNSSLLRKVLKLPGNPRLIDSELEITVEVSSNDTFSVKIRPGKTKVIDLMEMIQEKLEIPVKDQKVYHGKSRLSDAPHASLPPNLICSLHPTVVVIVPEYITITVEDMESGGSCKVKVDKAKTLKDLVDEIPFCRNLSENEAVSLRFKGEELCPPENDGSLSSLGFRSGSKLGIKRIRNREREIEIERERAREKLERKMTELDERREQKRPVSGFSELSKLSKKLSRKKTQREREALALPLPLPGAAYDDMSTSWESTSVYDDMRPPRPPPFACESNSYVDMSCFESIRPPHDDMSRDHEVGDPGRVLHENDPAWKAGGTTLQGYSSQQFTTADPIKVDPSKKVELILRLVARDDETDLVFPEDECKPLSTLYPPAVPE